MFGIMLCMACRKDSCLAKATCQRLLDKLAELAELDGEMDLVMESWYHHIAKAFDRAGTHDEVLLVARVVSNYLDNDQHRREELAAALTEQERIVIAVERLAIRIRGVAALDAIYQQARVAEQARLN